MIKQRIKRGWNRIAAGFALVMFVTCSVVADDLYSSGDKTWDTTTANWGTTNGSYSGASWNNVTPDSAFFEGTAGIVTLDEPISVRNLTISSANYTIRSNTLTFTTDGAIANAGNNVTLTCGIVGRPSVRVVTPTVNADLTFAPTAASVQLGTVTRITDTDLILGGTTTNNSVGKIVIGSGGDGRAKVWKEGAGTWTVGDVSFGRLTINDGHLIATGRLASSSWEFNLNAGGTLHYNSPRVMGSANTFNFRGGNLDNSSGAAITNSAYNHNYYLYGNTTFIGSRGANSDLNLGTGAVTINADRTVSVYSATTALTIGGPIGDNGDGHSLTKAGDGTLALTGTSTYLGDTIVAAGTLSVAQPYLSDIASVYLTNGAALNLSFTNTDVVLGVYTNGVEGAKGTWGALDSGADHETPLITGAGFLDVPVPTVLPGIRYWDGGESNIVGTGNALSDGNGGTWSSSIKNWDAGAGVAYTNWNNATNDLAVFRGGGGVVTLAEDSNLGSLFFDSAGYTLRSNTLHFGSGGAITAAADRVSISAGITGEPAMVFARGVNNVCTLAPTEASMTLGRFSSNSDDVLKLAGTTSGNSIAGVSANSKIDKESSSTWLIHGDVATPRRLYVDGGTLIFNGALAFTYTGARISSGATLVINGTMSGGNFRFNGGTLQGTGTSTLGINVPAGGVLAPGYPTGTMTITNSNCNIDGTLAIAVDGAACSRLAVDPGNMLTISNATLEVTVNAPPGDDLVIATYGVSNLVGRTFASDNLPSGWHVEYEYDGGTAIALVPPARGAVFMVR